MTSIIRELWYGNIDPIGDSGTDNKKMKRSAIAMESAEKAVSEALPSTSKPLFDAYEEAIEQYVLDSFRASLLRRLLHRAANRRGSVYRGGAGRLSPFAHQPAAVAPNR